MEKIMLLPFDTVVDFHSDMMIIFTGMTHIKQFVQLYIQQYNQQHQTTHASLVNVVSIRGNLIRRTLRYITLI